MKFSIAAIVAAAMGAAAYGLNVTYTTEVVTAYTTFCPAPTEIVHGEKTYTVTEAGHFTITDCPCTIAKPIITSSVVICNSCGYNATMTTKPTALATGGVVPTGGAGSKPTAVTAGAGKVAALSGGALAGVLGLAVFVL